MESSAHPPIAPPPGEPVLVHGFFERSAARFPDRPAVIDGPRTLTYADLDARANRLARHLRNLGVGPGQFVGLLCERSAEVYVGLLAILKAGAAYVPLDPDYPPGRIADILSDCAPVAVVTAGDPRKKLAGFPGRVIDLAADTDETADPLTDTGVSPTDLAYVIYTSGSTGRPKGVMVEHHSAAHLVRCEAELYRVGPDDRVFQGFSIAFDASVEEVWCAFAAGAALVVGTRDLMRAGPDLGRRLTDLGVTVFSTVPTLLAVLDGELATVRVLILGGEACPPELVARWHRPWRRLLNTYGPTEATVVATAAECAPDRPVTIGKPLPGYTVLILDESGRPVAPGEAGELHIGGVALARGYVGRPDLTRERFVPNPLGEPDRLYRTGDLGRWTPDGEIVFLGRCDAQVKLRGYRIELAEVEAAILEVPGVRAAAAAVHTDSAGVQKLVGYVVPGNGAVPEYTVQAHLRNRLPAYMVPGAVETLAELPTMPSGKVDRTKLPPPQPRAADRPAGLRPRTELEARVAATWEAAFAAGPVSVDDDFFLDLGGHSLLAARVISALRADPDLAHASVVDVYQHPTVAALARHLDRGRPIAPAAPPPFRPVPGWKFRLCGLAQLLALYPVLGVLSLQWVGPYLVYAALIADGWAVAPAVAAAVVSLVGVYPVMVVIGVLVKWVVIGRFRAGSYPLWGWYYFRWWLARAVLSLVPTGFLTGTPLLGLYYRLLGAKVGANVYLGSDEAFCHDLLTVGDDACIGTDVALRGYWVEGGMLHLGATRIGAGCTVGNRSVLQPGSAVEDGGKLGELSLLRRGDVIPAGERWAGSPARPVSREGKVPQTDRPGITRRFLLGGLYAVGSFLLPLCAITAYLPGVIAINAYSQQTPGYWYLLASPVVALSFVALFALEVAAVKWLLLGRLRAGTYPRHSLFHLRKWFVDRLMELSLDVTGTLYATIYLNPWYRLLGVKVGRMAEVSTACAIPHDLLTLGEESFVADAASVGGAQVDGETVTVGPVVIGRKAFAGNGAHLPPGSVLGDDGLIGCLSILPPEAEWPGTAWVGSPAFHLPQRQESAAFPAETINRPSLKLWVQRGLIEFVRVTLPGTALVALTAVLISTVIQLRDLGWELTEILAVFPLLYAAGGAAAALFVVALKWAVVGRYRPTERPLWSHFVWRAELISGVREHLADLFLIGLLRGTPFAAMYFRLLGATIGRRVFLDTTDLCEYDLISIGDDAALNDDCTMQTHLFEDRVMKVAPVEVGARAAVGGWSLVLYDTRIGPGAVIEDLSLLMKGEELPADTRWAGIPAQRE